MSELPTEHLITAARAGDSEAMASLLRRHLAGLRVFVRAKSSEAIRQQESCSDLVQTVCREVLGGLDGFEWRGDGSFRQWLFTVALNKIRNRAEYYGAQRRTPPGELGGDEELAKAYAPLLGPSQHAIAAEAVNSFERALDTLSDDHREIILLSRVVGLEHAEIAERLAIPGPTVRTRLGRALSRLATAMANEQPPTV